MMCHNFNIQNAQIEKFVENGMPQKIVKTVQHTIKKRSEEHRKEHKEANCELESCSKYMSNSANDTLKPSTKETPKELKITSENVMNTPKNSNLCDRFFIQKQQSSESDPSNVDEFVDENLKETAVVYVDALAIFTQLTKQFAQRLNQRVEKLQSSRIYTVLTKTTQPAHAIAIGILSFVLLSVWPDLLEVPDLKSTKTAPITSPLTHEGKCNILVILAYLAAFATHFGAQIWMTFVSGLSLYFSLPRHTFGQCQQILFPKYFALNSVLSISMLILFVKYFLNSWNISGIVQLSALSLTAVIEVTVRLYLAPPMLRLMHEKYKIEGAIGSGQEVGSIVQGDLIQCPHYQRIHKAFRRIHMTVAIGNMAALMATCLHLYFLASKIQIR